MAVLPEENFADNRSEKRNPYADCSTNPLCQVISYINDDLIFVSNNAVSNCKYSMSFGNGFICMSEGRKKYYQNFHK